jgi:hypothetical protein
MTESESESESESGREEGRGGWIPANMHIHSGLQVGIDLHK